MAVTAKWSSQIWEEVAASPAQRNQGSTLSWSFGTEGTNVQREHNRNLCGIIIPEIKEEREKKTKYFYFLICENAVLCNDYSVARKITLTCWPDV